MEKQNHSTEPLTDEFVEVTEGGIGKAINRLARDRDTMRLLMSGPSFSDHHASDPLASHF